MFEVGSIGNRDNWEVRTGRPSTKSFASAGMMGSRCCSLQYPPVFVHMFLIISIVITIINVMVRIRGKKVAIEIGVSISVNIDINIDNNIWCGRCGRGVKKGDEVGNKVAIGVIDVRSRKEVINNRAEDVLFKVEITARATISRVETEEETGIIVVDDLGRRDGFDNRDDK